MPQRAQAIALATLACLVMLPACARVGSGRADTDADRPGIRTVRAEAFARNDASDTREIAPAPPVTPGAAGDASPVPTRVRDQPGPAFGAEPVVVRGRPTQGTTPVAPAPPTPDGLELVEAKVGDINGRPIYISSFFEPIEARLIAEAQRLNRNDWLRLAAEEIISPRLDNLIADELLRAEALASLTPAQRMGLRSFLTGFRRDLLSENLGSEQLARRRIERESGQSLDEALREKENDTLIRLALFQQINRRINVSWRDIVQRYERDASVYNPNPTARFRLIRVPTADADALARVRTRLEQGEDFALIASDPANTFNPDTGGLHVVQYSGEYGQGQFFGSAALNEQARTLSPGSVSEPFVIGSSTSWLTLEEIERPLTSLYDAQLRISQELTQERRRQEQQVYLDRLIERARVGNRDEMFLRLLRIAEERYGPAR